MWKCLECNEQVDDDLDVCWNCETAKDGSPPDAYFHQKEVPEELVFLQERMTRYTDDDLIRIVTLDAKDYRKEALALARAELNKRGVDHPPRANSTNGSESKVLDNITETIDEAVVPSKQRVGLQARIFRILTLLKEQNLAGLKDFREEDATLFEITTPYAEHGHRTWLKYEPNNDGSAVRMELTHLFGRMDFDKGVEPAQLLGLLSMNVPSFRNSSAYIGANSIDGSFFVSLNATLIFLTKWSDEDIADALSIHLFDLVEMAFILEMPPPIEQFRADS
jgi:hypothetical protein